MEPCPSLTEFLAQPLGRCIWGRTWLYFYRDEGLCGFTLWDKPAPADLEELARVLVVELDRAPHVSLVDAHAVTWVDPRGFLVLERYVRAHEAALKRAVRRLALVRPEGMLGAVTAGFFGVAPQPYPVKVCRERRAALEWLGVPDAAAAAEELTTAERWTTQHPATLGELRAWLEGHLEHATLPEAARALGLSERTLQRRLGDHRATFLEEVSRARVAVAQRLLETTQMQLTAIALEVGCASPQSFSALFRRVAGVTPTAWRAKAQRPPKKKARTVSKG